MGIIKLIVLILISIASGVLSIPASLPRPSGDSKNVESTVLLRKTENGNLPLNHVARSPVDPATGDLETADTFIGLGLYGGYGGWGGYGGYGGFGYPYGGYGGYGFGGYPYGGYGFYG